MDNIVKVEKSRKWYNGYKFPLLPVIQKRDGNEHNTSSWSFDWLFIKLWTLDAFQFEITLTADTHWGIGVIGLLPYLRFVFCIPCPNRLQMWVQKYLWRHPPNHSSKP